MENANVHWHSRPVRLQNVPTMITQLLLLSANGGLCPHVPGTVPGVTFATGSGNWTLCLKIGLCWRVWHGACSRAWYGAMTDNDYGKQCMWMQKRHLSTPALILKSACWSAYCSISNGKAIHKSLHKYISWNGYCSNSNDHTQSSSTNTYFELCTVRSHMTLQLVPPRIRIMKSLLFDLKCR